MARTKNQEQTQWLEAIAYFEALKEKAPKNNPKIIEMLDRAERDSHTGLYKLLKGKIPKSQANP